MIWSCHLGRKWFLFLKQSVAAVFAAHARQAVNPGFQRVRFFCIIGLARGTAKLEFLLLGNLERSLFLMFLGEKQK